MDKFKCLICDGTEWVNVDEYRVIKAGMEMCLNCGFVTYPEIVKKSADLTEFYREEYRNAPQVQNVFTGQRKLHYHEAFLGKHLWPKWREAKKEAPVVFEVGAAFGMFLDYVRKTFPKADISGTELTLTFRRVAWHEYGIKLTEQIDESKKYDMIATYKVAEHIPDIGVHLDKYFSALKDDGFLYISVPTWFHTMMNFGIDGFDFENYYHKNHINVWTRTLFETLLAKHGFEPIEKNTAYYDATYLCKKNAAAKEKPPQYEVPADIIDKMKRIRDACLAAEKRDYAGAIALFPAFPDAHVNAYEHTRAQWHPQGWEAIHEKVIKPALAACPEASKLRIFAADLATRYDQFQLAMDYLREALELKPMDAAAMLMLGQTNRALAQIDQKNSEKYLQSAREITRAVQKASFQHIHDTVTLIFSDNAKLPMPDEAN